MPPRSVVPLLPSGLPDLVALSGRAPLSPPESPGLTAQDAPRSSNGGLAISQDPWDAAPPTDDGRGPSGTPFRRLCPPTLHTFEGCWQTLERVYRARLAGQISHPLAVSLAKIAQTAMLGHQGRSTPDKPNVVEKAKGKAIPNPEKPPKPGQPEPEPPAEPTYEALLEEAERLRARGDGAGR